MEATPDQIIQEQAADTVVAGAVIAPLPPILTVLARHFLNPDACGLKMELLKANFG